MMGHESDDSRAPSPASRDDVLHAGMIREGLRIARGLSAPADVHTLEPMSEAFKGVWCSDSEGGEPC